MQIYNERSGLVELSDMERVESSYENCGALSTIAWGSTLFSVVGNVVALQKTITCIPDCDVPARSWIAIATIVPSITMIFACFPSCLYCEPKGSWQEKAKKVRIIVTGVSFALNAAIGIWNMATMPPGESSPNFQNFPP